MSKDSSSQNIQPLWRLTTWFPTIKVETIERLRLFHRELLQFNQKLNLISRATELDADSIHFADAIFGARALLAATQASEVVDIGSGNGIPGLVLALLAPERKVLLVEKDERKAEFLRHMKHKMDLQNVEIKNMRIEDLPPLSVSCAVSRGFASLTKSLVTVRKVFGPQAEYFHFKGSQWLREVTELPEQLCSAWNTEVVTQYELPTEEGLRVLLVSRKNE